MAPLFVGFTTIFVLVGALGAWAMRTEIAGAVVASGRIIVEKNRQAVQHPDGGVIQDIMIQEGDVVEEGQVLISIDPSLQESELSIVEGQLVEIRARRGRLEAEQNDATEIVFDAELLEKAATTPEVARVVESQRQLFEARKETLEKAVNQLQNQRVQLENQVTGIDAQMTALERQEELVKVETGNQESLLQQGLAQASRVLNLQREGARLSGQVGELTARRAQALERIAELSIEELQLYAQRREQAITRLSDLQINDRGLSEQRRSLIQQLERMEIRAPVAGIVYDMRVFGRRSVIRPAEPVLYLVPQNRPLVIEARVNPVNIDEVYMGQEVLLQFSSFDMRDTPDLYGAVTQLSADAFTDEQSGAPFYRVEINMPEEEAAKLAGDQVLVPGMPVDAFIRTEDRTPAAYLLSPITRYFDKAFRDG
ncbi:HlyD family type I secretion periplasmic adaptor subunit (plasmid) [Sulfitobacter sp. S190]|nr:HlyD family type I secretion periplasmic adaptor subunit [Sulfitobacter sp. S190]